MGKHCQVFEHEKVLYFCMQIKLKKDKGEEITRMVDAQWILRMMEATHMDSLVNRVQERHIFDTWGGATMEWLKNNVIKKYHGMRTRGLMTGTDDEIKSKAVRTARLIRRGLLEEEGSGDYDFPLNQVRLLDPTRFPYR
jgi:hypothetical protein